MRSLLRSRFVLTLALAGVLAACTADREAGLGPDVRRGLSAGRDYASALALLGRRAVDVDTEIAVALGYLERHRIGIGGPFRLIDYALKDPRLGAETRERLAWALLALTVDGAGYQVDPAALDRIGVADVIGTASVGHYHLELIDGAISQARDPRGGELAVRIAYALAAAEASVGPRAALLASQAAAQIRDRELARHDALRLLRAAESAAMDPFTLLPLWRAERRLEVEQPSLATLPIYVEREAMELAPLLMASIRELVPRIMAGETGRQSVAHARASFLGPGAAARLAEAADSLNAPPQTPLVVAVDVHRRELMDRPSANREVAIARSRFVERATNEEKFVAELARLGHVDSSATGPALVALWGAVAMRTYAQEEPWFPGMPGPSTRELEDRFGLGFVRFDPDVPATWRNYYRRMLLVSLNDLQRALPSVDLRGAGIHFGENSGRSATLAMHDPRTRTLYLPPATSAGTIAHEVAHDLDWQVALRRYRVRGDYATDRATRQPTDRLAVVLRDLATGELRAPQPGDAAPPAHANRPAEVFARSVDWFVVAALAREGRVNGYLSSVQDDVLTGYGTVTPPDISGQAGAALVSILDEIAPLYPGTRRAFLESYGRGRTLTPYDLIRRVLEAPIAPGALALDANPHVLTVDEAGEDQPVAGPVAAAAWTLRQVEQARDAAFAAIDAWICQVPGAAYDRGLETARRKLVARTASARARGIALAYARQIAGAQGRRWLARHFYGPTWPSGDVDSATVEWLRELADQVRNLEQIGLPDPPPHFQLIQPPDRCAAGPLIAGLQ